MGPIRAPVTRSPERWDRNEEGLLVMASFDSGSLVTVSVANKIWIFPRYDKSHLSLTPNKFCL
jgi:hypothetical protein